MFLSYAFNPPPGATRRYFSLSLTNLVRLPMHTASPPAPQRPCHPPRPVRPITARARAQIDCMNVFAASDGVASLLMRWPSDDGRLLLQCAAPVSHRSERGIPGAAELPPALSGI